MRFFRAPSSPPSRAQGGLRAHKAERALHLHDGDLGVVQEKHAPDEPRELSFTIPAGERGCIAHALRHRHEGARNQLLSVRDRHDDGWRLALRGERRQGSNEHIVLKWVLPAKPLLDDRLIEEATHREEDFARR